MFSTAVLVLVVAAGSEWTKQDSGNGIELFARELPEERFNELKLVSLSTQSVSSLCAAAFGSATLSPGEPSVVSRNLIREAHWKTGKERVTYEQVTPPMVSARDFAVRRKQELLPNGSCRVTFSSANDLAPPCPKGMVRIEKLRGTWEFEPAGTSTRITYTVFSDPGGDIPPAFVHKSLVGAAVDWMKFIVKSARRTGGTVASSL